MNEFKEGRRMKNPFFKKKFPLTPWNWIEKEKHTNTHTHTEREKDYQMNPIGLRRSIYEFFVDRWWDWISDNVV